MGWNKKNTNHMLISMLKLSVISIVLIMLVFVVQKEEKREKQVCATVSDASYYIKYNSSTGSLSASDESSLPSDLGLKVESSLEGNVLVMEGIDFTSTNQYALYIEGDATIEVRADSKLAISSSTYYENYYGIYCTGKLKIKGASNLTVNFDKTVTGGSQWNKSVPRTMGIFSKSGFDVNMEGMININNNSGVLCKDFYGIRVESGDVNITLGKIKIINNVECSDQKSILSQGTCIGIYVVVGSIKISGDVEIKNNNNCVGKYYGIQLEDSASTFSMPSGNISIVLSEGYSINEGCGIWSQGEVKIGDGINKPIVNVNLVAKQFVKGIVSSGKMEILNSEITINISLSGTITYLSSDTFGIAILKRDLSRTGTIMKILDSEVIINATSAAKNIGGLKTGDASDATGEATSSISEGDYDEYDIVINGGNMAINVTSNNGSDSEYGINSKNNYIQESGNVKVNITGSNAQTGINTIRNININDGVLEIIAGASVMRKVPVIREYMAITHSGDAKESSTPLGTADGCIGYKYVKIQPNYNLLYKEGKMYRNYMDSSDTEKEEEIDMLKKGCSVDSLDASNIKLKLSNFSFETAGRYALKIASPVTLELEGINKLFVNVRNDGSGNNSCDSVLNIDGDTSIIGNGSIEITAKQDYKDINNSYLATEFIGVKVSEQANLSINTSEKIENIEGNINVHSEDFDIAYGIKSNIDALESKGNLDILGGIINIDISGASTRGYGIDIADKLKIKNSKVNVYNNTDSLEAYGMKVSKGIEIKTADVIAKGKTRAIVIDTKDASDIHGNIKVSTEFKTGIVKKDSEVTDETIDYKDSELQDILTLKEEQKCIKIEPMIISVDITWGTMDFEYNKTDWNPSKHIYDTMGWNPSTTTDSNKTVISNSRSNVPIKAKVNYTPIPEMTTKYNILGKIVDSTNNVKTNVAVQVNESENISTYLILENEPLSEVPTRTTIGKVNVDLEEVLVTYE